MTLLCCNLKINQMSLPRPIKRTLLSFAPMPLWLLLRMEFYFLRIRLRRSTLVRRFADTKNALVNFGAGPAGKPGWINVDAFEAKGVNCVWDCRYSLPLPGNSVRGIFTEHFLEHLDYQTDAPAFLKECLRIMQPGAVIRIIVPDAGAFLRAYCAPDWDDMIKLRLSGEDRKDIGYGIVYQTKMQVVNVLFRQFDEHKYAYDFETLRDLLVNVGFSEVTHGEFGVSRLPELAIDMAWRSRESLYVEASKT